MNVAWAENKVGSAGTLGTIGLFGSNDAAERYFFYLRFTPFFNIATTSTAGTFRIWFELGKKGSSEWHGVYYTKTQLSPFTAG